MTRSANGRFMKQHSGNPNGRPRKPKTEIAGSRELLDKRFSAEINGLHRELTTEEALSLKILQEALTGDRHETREVARMIRKRDAYLDKHSERANSVGASAVELKLSYDTDNIDEAMLLLEIAVQEPFFVEIPDSRVVIKIATWAAQAAMSRPRAPDISDDDLGMIRNLVSQSDKVRWK